MAAQVPTSLFAEQFVSYAQNYEDVMLRRALRHVERGFYIDVGAQSAESDSVTKAFSLMGWCGINIEPHPFYFEQLVRLRPKDINLDVALGEQPGALTMNLVEDSGLSTADDEIAARHAASGYAVRTHEVRMLTLDQVWRQHVPDGQPVHFLKVDVEGFERLVLAGNDWQRHRPWIVLVEATLPNSQVENHEGWEPILVNAGYKYVYADGLNRFYVADEHPELLGAFKYPPNVFDAFVVAPFDGLRREHSRLASELGIVQNRASNLQQHADALEGSLQESQLRLQESQRRIERVEADLAAACAREVALQVRLEAERGVLLEELRKCHDSLAQATARAECAERAHGAIVQSPWWRVTAPGRALLGRVPRPVRRQALRLAKAAWWVATPWRIPARLRLVRERDGRAMQAEPVVAEPADLNLYPDRTPGQPPVPPVEARPGEVTDRTTAARWCIWVLRSQPDIRARFPCALSEPEADGFIAWVRDEGGERFALSESACSLVVAVLQEDFGIRARRCYLGRLDLRLLCPGGLTPSGQRDLYRWFVQHGCAECQVSLDEVLWFFIQVSEANDAGAVDIA